MFTSMQQEYFRNATHRWNTKTGATRSGKTYMDYYVIPKRIRNVAGKPGDILLLGHTQGTLVRNVLYPLMDIWGSELVQPIRQSDNTAMLFGERCYCLGADKKTSVDKIRGMSVKYCYGDEIVTWSEPVFDMLKSRLDKPYSTFDGTCNPEGRQHWFKKFLDSDVDIYCQKYTLDDNPTLDPNFVNALKKEYAGTVYYDRYVLGNWVNAEGIIYRKFNDRPDDFIIEDLNGLDLVFATVGVDFGGGKSAHAFDCTGFSRGLGQIVTVHDYHRKDAATPQQLYDDFVQFIIECRLILGNVPLVDIYCDSAEQTLIAGLRVEAARRGLKVEIHNAKKSPINDRIRFYTAMMGAGRYKILKSCQTTIDALSEAMWDDDKKTVDVRLDDGTTNIDNLDALEYSTEPYMREMLERVIMI